MRLKRISKAVAAGAALGLMLSACAPADEGGEAGQGGGETAQVESIATTVGPNEFISYNGYTPETYSTYNSAIVDRLKASFSYFDGEGVLQPNTDLGSYEMVSEDPMVIEYTINDNAAWSDGTPITVADVVLAWGVQNAEMTNADGDPLFNSVSQDMGTDVPEGPQGEPDGKTFTVEFAAPNPDWQLLTWLLDPAHVVAEQAGISTEDLVTAIREGDAEALAPVAEFWNTGWNTNPGELPEESMVPVSGPYKLKSWEPGQSVTLEANEEYYGEAMAPQNDELVFRFVAPDAMVQALENGDVNVIEPQATVDTLDQLEGIGDAVNVHQYDTLIWEHLDFNFGEGSVFADNLELREAFAMCVPRQQIVENLIQPLNPEAQVMNLREYFPFQDEYSEVEEYAYDGRYDEADVEGAKEILEANDAVGTEVRIGYSAPNPRRTDEVAMIKSSCDEAGFVIEDAGNADFFEPGGTQQRGDYEVALFAWAGSGQIVSGENIYATDSPQNYGQYSNEEVDALWEEVRTSVDPEVHMEAKKDIEKILWDDLFGIPLFAHPGVGASSASIENVQGTPTQNGIVWNAYEWNRAE